MSAASSVAGVGVEREAVGGNTLPPGPWSRVTRHPVATVFLIALAARLVSAVVLNALGYQIPDEQQYIDLAGTVASGLSAEDWVPGYGQALYDSTFAFTGLLRLLYEATGTSRMAGQVMSAVAGSLTAALTAQLLHRRAGARAAVTAGLVVALMPSQVLWSSTVLRESFVWLGLAVVAAAVAVSARTNRTGPLLGCLAATAGGLLLLGTLRDQTMLVAAYAVALTPWCYRPARARWGQRVAALSLAITVPLAAGVGFGGYDLVVRAVPNLAVARANLSLGAESAIDKDGVNAPADMGPASDLGSSPGTGSAAEEPEADGPGYLVTTQPGAVIDVDGASGELSYLPKGLLAVTLRPFAWEGRLSLSTSLAKVENVAWLVLYGLALAGIPAAWGLRTVMTFPVIGTVGVLLSSALTQGNLGTAFRHRAQLLWAIAALAGLGAVALRSRLADRSAQRSACADSAE